MKFDSGTGWPSFFTLIPDSARARRKIYKLILPRTEYHCVRCGGHQGHVFDDGPQPTGLRYCNNGVALQLHSAAAGVGHLSPGARRPARFCCSASSWRTARRRLSATESW